MLVYPMFTLIFLLHLNCFLVIQNTSFYVDKILIERSFVFRKIQTFYMQNDWEEINIEKSNDSSVYSDDSVYLDI